MTYLERYRQGQYAEVWADLVALGPAVRDEPHFADAKAVAEETMRRARQNVETIIDRLDQLGYVFNNRPSEPALPSGVNVSPATELRITRTLDYVTKLGLPEYKDDPLRHEAFDWARAQGIPLGGGANQKGQEKPEPVPTAELDDFERRHGPLPMSLRAWYEIVGPVDFCGSHLVLMSTALKYSPDPLVVDALEGADVTLDMFDDEDDDEEDGETRRLLWLAPDDLHKINVSGGSPYGMYIPEPNADAEFANYARGVTFVQYLRETFRWGGFPGLQLAGSHIPRQELDFLTKDLLPL